MAEREIRIIKPADPEKLVVIRASSLNKKVKFYVNENECIVGEIKDENNIELNLHDDSTDPENIQQMSLKENFKFVLKSAPMILIAAALDLLYTISIFFLVNFLNNTFLAILLISTIPLITKMSAIIIIELKQKSILQKSKHAAEHMMVNFLETHKRLPKSLKELKKSSRFSKGCNSREKITGFTENYLSLAFAGIITYFAECFLSFLFKNIIIYIIILILIYVVFYFSTNIALKKIKKLKIIVTPLENLLSNIVQCANTTKKVEGIDFLLVYLVAQKWIKLVYPEFYDENEDTFLDNFLEE